MEPVNINELNKLKKAELLNKADNYGIRIPENLKLKKEILDFLINEFDDLDLLTINEVNAEKDLELKVQLKQLELQLAQINARQF